MRIERKGNSELIIYENIKSVDDYTVIRTAITGMLAHCGGELHLQIPDSFSMPSSVIGFMIQLVAEGSVKLRLKAGNNNLFELLDEMNLVATLNVQR